MFTSRFAFLVVACPLALFSWTSTLEAQEYKQSMQHALKVAVPAAAAGTRIDAAQEAWAYIAAAVGFILTFLLAWFLVRVVAFLVVTGCFLAGIGLVCAVVHDKVVTTWEQLAVVVLYAGVFAGITAVTANLYLIKGGMEGDGKGS